MKFYEIDGAVQDAIETADKPVRIKIEIENNGHFKTVDDRRIIEAHF